MRNTIVKKMCPVIHSIYSIIIPTYHRPEILQKTLQTLDDQSFRDFEVIVVHDGQGVQTKEMIVALRKKLRYPLMFIEQKHKGPAAARNRGIAEASGEFILLLGDDMVPHKDCLQQHHLCRTEDKNSVIVGFVDWHPDLIVTPFMRYLSPKGPQFTFHAIRDPQNVSFQFFYTANLSIPKQVLLENPFDEDFPYAAVEDTELGYRLQKKGVRLVYCQESICYHHHIITLP